MNARLLGTRLYILFGIAACFSATVAGSAYAEIQEPPSLQRFTSGGHVLGFDETGYFASNGTYALRVRFEGASGSSGSVVGTSPGTGTSGATASAVPEFEGISYEDVWPGIGVEYDAPKSGIARSTWTVAPGADPKTIQLRYNRPVALTGNGSLQIGFETGTMTESAPIAWQDVDGKRQPVEVSFATTDDDLVGFAVGAYRSDLPLVIDPTLVWNTFLGGSGQDDAQSIAVDASGNVYVGGESNATWGSPERAYTADYDAFAAKLDSAGNLLWNTFLGGSGADYGAGIAVDASGNVYVGGDSEATWGSPVRAYAAGQADAFAARLDSAGVLQWNTFTGAGGFTTGHAIALDAVGNAYLTGSSESLGWGDPVLSPSVFSGLYAYVVKLDSASGVRFWNLFLGQDGADIPTGIAVDAADNIYVVGYTDGTWGSLIRAYTGSNYSFVAKLSQWACGNAVVEASEECDDGNTDDGDCCASTCNFEAAGASCADGDLCNGNETCDGAGSCDAGAPLDCSDGDLCTQDSCDPVLGCENVGEPATGCVDGWGKGMLLVKEKVGGKEKLIAKFIKGPEILAAEFGDPREVGGTTYGVCLYDDAGALVEGLHIDRAGFTCGSKACWSDKGPRGFFYKDGEVSADGVSQLRLSAGPAEKTMILLKGGNNSRKSQLDLPTGIAAGLSASASATLQIVGDDAPACFSLTLDKVKKQEADFFKAVK